MVTETQTTMSQQVLPSDFLTTPAENISVTRIDFSQTSLYKEYKGRYAVILDNVLSPAECETLIKGAEATAANGWERAMINVGQGQQMLMTDSRNCGRIIWDSRELVAKVWKRIEHVPEVQEIVRLENVAHIFGNGPQKREEVWKFSRPNERMRFLKYVGTYTDGCSHLRERDTLADVEVPFVASRQS